MQLFVSTPHVYYINHISHHDSIITITTAQEVGNVVGQRKYSFLQFNRKTVLFIIRYTCQ